MRELGGHHMVTRALYLHTTTMNAAHQKID
jgi:hypothetical protein